MRCLRRRRWCAIAPRRQRLDPNTKPRGADDPTSAREEIQRQCDEDYDWEGQEDPESRRDWNHVIYFNDGESFTDGDVLTHNQRKFRVHIEEVEDLPDPPGREWCHTHGLVFYPCAECAATSEQEKAK